MRRALELAREAGEAGEVPVGAVVVLDSEVVGEGTNRNLRDTDPTAHAEIVALRAAAGAVGNHRLVGAEVFVTLEPCAMCAGALSHARVARVVYGATDGKGGAVGSGVRFFQHPTCHSRPEVEAGLMGDESAELLKAFFRARRRAGLPRDSGEPNRAG